MVSPFKKAQKHPDSLLHNKNNIKLNIERERERQRDWVSLVVLPWPCKCKFDMSERGSTGVAFCFSVLHLYLPCLLFLAHETPTWKGISADHQKISWNARHTHPKEEQNGNKVMSEWVVWLVRWEGLIQVSEVLGFFFLPCIHCFSLFSA